MARKTRRFLCSASSKQDRWSCTADVKQEIFEKIPVISFAMMCEVMLYHCESPDISMAFNSRDLWWNQFLVNVVYGPFALLCMSWFFAITGFLLFRNLTLHNLGAKLKTRVITLFIPYVLWQVIYIIKSILQGNTWTIKEMFSKVFLLRIWPPLGAFWYIYAIFLLSLLSPVFLLLFRSEKCGWFSTVILIILLYVYGSNLSINDGNYYYIGNIKAYFPAYLIGSFFGHIYEKSSIWQKLKYVVLFLLIGILLDPVIRKLLANMTIAVMPVLILFLLPIPAWYKNRKLYHLNFLIYATHQSIISLSINPIRALILALIPYISIANILGNILCILLIIAVNAGIHTFMSHFTPKTLKLLTGGRC